MCQTAKTYMYTDDVNEKNDVESLYRYCVHCTPNTGIDFSRRILSRTLKIKDDETYDSYIVRFTCTIICTKRNDNSYDNNDSIIA